MDKSSEERGIREAIAHYADGMRTGDIEALKQGFHEQAILCGYLDDELIAAPIAALYDWVGANPAPAATGEPFDCEVLEIEVTNRVRRDRSGNRSPRHRDRSFPPAQGQRAMVDCQQALGRRAVVHEPSPNVTTSDRCAQSEHSTRGGPPGGASRLASIPVMRLFLARWSNRPYREARTTTAEGVLGS